jgi:methionyl-tRNA formyltransferase
MSKIRTYFMGSGVIAAPVLESLVGAESIQLLGVCTQPDKPAGRKKSLTPTPIGDWCAKNSVAVDKPLTVNTPEFSAKLAEMNLDFIFVVSFGQILKQPILDAPNIACVNLHASLLPRHRGASPIAAAILAGDPETGVTFMKMDAGLDTGPEYAKFAYSPTDERADELEIILGRIGAEHAEGILARIASGELQPKPQDDSKATHSGKIRKSDALINWNEPAVVVKRRVRAYHPWPGAHFFVDTPKRKIKLTLTKVDVVEKPENSEPGETILADKTGWTIACGEKAVSISTLKPEGRNEMTAAEFLRGRPELMKSLQPQ